jgi:hypothetical protein
MLEWFSSRRDSTIVARHFVPWPFGAAGSHATLNDAQIGAGIRQPC